MNNLKLVEKGICEVMDELFLDWLTNFSRTYVEESEALLKYCKENNFYLYEKCKEDYFEWEGYEEALKGGFKGVVYSNLS